MNYSEYSRLRSIAQKRINRASAAGYGPRVQIPTVADVKASADPDAFMAAVKNFLKNPGLRDVREQGISYPEFDLPDVPVTKKQSLSPEEKRARRNEQKRRSKAKRAVERAAATEAEGRKKVGYLKALETVSKQWREMGLDVGNWLGVMSPGMSKKFVEYMEYRFSQGDYKNRYAIDTFIKDFGTLVQRGYDFKDIKGDFDSFLFKQKELMRNKSKAQRYGIDSDEVDSAWRKFVNR